MNETKGKTQETEQKGWGIYVPTKGVNHNAIAQYFEEVLTKRAKITRAQKRTAKGGAR